MQLEPRVGVAKSKLLGLAALALTVLLAAWAYVATCATYTQDVTFSLEDLRFSKAGDYDLVSLEGARWLAEPGKPRLPMVPIRVALPAASRMLKISVVACDSVEVAGVFSIIPSQPPQPLSAERRAEFVPPVPEVYLWHGPYPRRRVELVGSGEIAGATLCDVLVYPLRYFPLERRLVLYSRLKFRLEYETVGASPEAKNPSSDELDLLARLTSNRTSPWRASQRVIKDHIPMGGGEINYLIITNNALRTSFEPLRVWKTRKGLASETITTETIAGSYPGSDLQEKIRNCIKYYHVNCGTEWVLLGGNAQIIPDRKAYVAISDKPYIPCDLYYGDLDGTWNDDGDLYWGETPSDNIDMYSDVFIGRAPVATPDEALTFAEKVLAYEGFYTLPADYQMRMLFLAEVLWGDPGNPSDPDYTDGAVAKNLVDDWYVPAGFSITKLYQTSGNLNYGTAISNLDLGMGFVNICCHGFYKTISLYEDFLANDDFGMLTSDGRYGLMYSASCLSGGFDQNDCIGEAWVLSPRGGGFYIGNSRYGWGTPGEPGDGPSDHYDQSFFESVFITGFTNLGKAHADAKHEYVGESRADPYMRYLMYGLNLLGDPELSLWTQPPRTMQVVCPSAIDTSPQAFVVSVTSAGAPLAGAKVCLWKSGQVSNEIYAVGESDGSGTVSLPVDAATAGTLLVTVTRPNVIPFVGQVLVSAAPPHPAPPAGLAVTEGAGPSVRLTWSPVADGDLTAYRIYRNTSASPQFYCAVGAAETTYTDGAVVAGTTYYYWVTAVDEPGDESPFAEPSSIPVQGNVGVPDLDDPALPAIAIDPNPFQVSVRLSFKGERGATAEVGIYDVDGRCVATPAMREQVGGRWDAVWEGDDSAGRRVAPGLYFVKCTSGTAVHTRKMAMLR